MRKLILVLAALFGLTAQAAAGVSCVLPFTITNGTLGDATQVQANYAALVVCLNNAAAAGANNDITSLVALSTPITGPQGGTTTYVGATSTGSANAQVLTSVVPSSFTLAAGNSVVFTAGFTNTGPTQLNIGGTGLVNLFRRTQLGISAVVGGEIVLGQSITVRYDGTQYQLVSSGPSIVGQMIDFVGPTAPGGWAFPDGSCQLRVGVFADLFSLISTTYDPTGTTCDILHFAMPDGRGRVLAGRDDMGGTAANRITSAITGCTGTALGGAGCGAQNVTLATNQIPQMPVAFSGGFVPAKYLPGALVNTGSGFAVVTDQGSLTATVGAASPATVNKLMPMQVVNKILKY